MQAFKNFCGWVLLLGIGYNIGYWVREIQEHKNAPVQQQRDAQPEIRIQGSPEKVNWV